VAWLRIGKVVRALGLGGYLGVAGSEGALAGLRRVVLRREGRDSERQVLEARRQGRLWAVRLEGVDGRSAAEEWVGAEVLAERADLGQAGPGRHFWADLEGLPVVTADGRAVGRVTGLFPTGGVDVLVVTGEAGEVLIPLAPYAAVEADRVVVDPPEGLLEPTRAGRERTRKPRGKPQWPRSRSRS
jgi:16S rRNA processing protein RimM